MIISHKTNYVDCWSYHFSCLTSSLTFTLLETNYVASLEMRWRWCGPFLSDDGQGVIHTLASSLPDEILSIPSFPLRLQTFPNYLSRFTSSFSFSAVSVACGMWWLLSRILMPDWGRERSWPRDCVFNYLCWGMLENREDWRHDSDQVLHNIIVNCHRYIHTMQ